MCLDTVSELSSHCANVIDPNDLAEWLEDGLGQEGPWNNVADPIQQVNRFLKYRLSEVTENTLPIRVELGATSKSNHWLDVVRDKALPHLMREINNYG